MSLKIWEKNYLLAMGLLLFLLFGSMLFIQQYSFRKNLDFYCERTLFNESRAEYEISSLLAGRDGAEGLERKMCRALWGWESRRNFPIRECVWKTEK